jgi:drug/metabolite transporter (DMT)-like permease
VARVRMRRELRLSRSPHPILPSWRSEFGVSARARIGTGTPGAHRFIAIGERLAPAQIAAVTLITGGILALVIGKGSDWTAAGFALATGISIATYSFFGGLGVRSSASILGFQAWLEILTGLGILIFAAISRRGQIRAFARTSGGMGLLAGVLSVSGYLVFLTAAKVLPMAPVAALRECSLIFGTIIGAVFLKEGFGLRRIAAAVLVTSGIIALAAGAFR